MLTRLFKRFGLQRAPETQKYALDASLHVALNSLAEEQQRSPDEMASDLLGEALSRRQIDTELLHKWESLSLRQQQVTALICLGYTNRQIAAKLGISIATVHTHSGNIQGTFGVNSKADLRYLLVGWDFNSWDR
jgi:DNA-binding NarL/FixJ family response regulator